jgi:transposase
MLKTDLLIPLSDEERNLFESVVPRDHFLRQLLEAVDFEGFRPLLATAYSNLGRPAEDPVLMFKLEILERQYRLSDREVICEARCNIAHRLFLGLSLKSPLPHHTTMTYFRQRLGTEREQQVFDEVVRQARRLGLVKDRLRLKDPTHVLANIAVPSGIKLVAAVRERLFEALRPFAPERVAEEIERADAIRVGSADAKDQDRLLQRVAHLRAVLAWADEILVQPAFREASEIHQKGLRQALALARKVLADRDDPQGGDKLRSVHDPDARCGKHGDFFDGYLLDVSMDADSEIITQINILPGNGDEGADTVYLLASEEAAHGNDVAAVSTDGAGYRGDVLHELTRPEGMKVEVFAPPTERIPLVVFGPEDFSLGDDGKTLTCPAGQTTKQREHHKHGTKFRFAQKQCGNCPRRGECLADPKTKGRTVIKNQYEAEYRAAQAKAQTPEFAEVRKQHPAIERKLSELVNRHGMRRARYRGQRGVLWQALMTALVVNCKRIVRLIADRVTAALAPPDAQGAVRAELNTSNA